MAFSGNPIWFADPNGADTTLRGGDGRNITLPTGASGITTANGSPQQLQNSTATVSPSAGTLLSFNINGKSFNAGFGESSGQFKGYFSGDLSYNDYAAQQAASGDGSMQAGLMGTLTMTRGLGGAGSISAGAALPAIPIAGFQVGWNYGQTHADKITGWVEGLAGWAAGAIGAKVVADGVTTIIPPGTPTKVYEIGGWNPSGMVWQTLKYGVASTEYDTYGGAGNRRPDSQLEAMRTKYPHLIVGQTTLSVVNSKAAAHILENNLVFLHILRKGAAPPEQGLPFGLGPL